MEVQRATRAVRLPAGATLQRWVEAAGASGTVTIRLVGWPESRRLNENFRHKSGPTNVLAFPATSAERTEAQLGDLVICLPLVYREAREQGKKPLQHLAHLVVHGVLHLLGHEHGQSAAARKMEKMETDILKRLGFPDPYHALPAERIRMRQ